MERKSKKILKIISTILIVIILISGSAVFALAYYGILGTYPSLKPKDGQIRVACVGDSITYGNSLQNWFKNTYPLQLGKLLGDSYYVGNFGDSARTAMSTGDRPYQNDTAYNLSIQFASEIVIIMLGTNDSKTFNWQGKDEFKRQYGELIDIYLALESTKELYICIPPAIYEDKWSMQTNIIDNDIPEAVRELAAEKELFLIDIAAAMNGHPELFSDKVHPNKDGAKVFAQIVYEAIIK